MRTNLFLLPILLTLSTITQAQKSKPTVEEFKKLGRDSLIKMAIAKINDSTFHAKYYDRVTVKANATTVQVEFELSIRLRSGKNCFYDNVSVGLLNGTTGTGVSGDCDKVTYYKPTSSSQKKIDFVFASINKSDEIGHLPGNKIPEGATMTIDEHSSYYYVEFSDESTFSHYKIDKSSGKISEAGHKEYARPEKDPDNWEIIH